MGKIDIRYQDEKCSYTFLIPKNYDHFQIIKYSNKDSEDSEYIMFIYNYGKTTVYHCTNILVDFKREEIIDSNLKKQIIEELVLNVIKNTNFSSESIAVANILGIKINNLKNSNIVYMNNINENTINKIKVEINSPFENNINGSFYCDDREIKINNDFFKDIIKLISNYVVSKNGSYEIDTGNIESSNKILSMENYKKGRTK